MDKNRPFVFGDDDDDDRKTLERARKLSQRNQNQESPQPIFGVLAGIINSNPEVEDNEKLPVTSGEDSQEENKKIIFEETEEFVWRHHLDKESHKGDQEDVFMEKKDLGPTQEPKKEEEEDENFLTIIHEIPVGKGLWGALNLLKQRGDIKEEETIDKKQKRKLINGEKEIVIERKDENGRNLTPKEAFRLFCHNFHGTCPGKKKQEKRMQQEELKMKIKINQMNNGASSLSVPRMRNALAQLKSPYLVISGNVKPGQNSDPRNKFGLLYRQTADTGFGFT